MWNTEIVDKVKAIYEGIQGEKKDQELIRKYMMFYGMSNEIGNYCYVISYESVMKMLNKEKQNKFLWIEYEPTHELIFTANE